MTKQSLYIRLMPISIDPCQIVASGVCHTDWTFLHEVGQTMNPQPFPVILGHEGAGVVESVGPGVTKMSKGKQKSTMETFYPNYFNTIYNCITPSKTARHLGVV